MKTKFKNQLKEKIKWFHFWHPDSGEMGGVILGLVICIVICFFVILGYCVN